MKKLGFKVYLNDQLISTHGMDTDGVVSQIINLKNDMKENEQSIYIHCGGFRSDIQEHYKWVDRALKPNDKITIEMVEDAVYDSPIEVKPHDNPAMDEFILQSKLKTFYNLKEELKEYIEE